jgi:hypothetical protein
MSAQPAALSDAERAELAQWTEEAKRGQHITWAALKKIHDGKLYREYGTWEAYCLSEWGYARTNAHYILGAARVVENVQRVEHLPAPTMRRQTIPLATLPEEQQPAAWAEAVDRSGGKPTGAVVAEVVKEMRQPTPIRPVEQWEPAEQEGDTQEDEGNALARFP